MNTLEKIHGTATKSVAEPLKDQGGPWSPQNFWKKLKKKLKYPK